MSETRYKVMINNEIVAQDLNFKTAAILVRALCEEYYTVSIKQMERVECVR